MSNQPLDMGFLSGLHSISFPGRPRIVTAEVKGITLNTGNYSYNGEAFVFGANRPVGPNNNITAVGLVPGVTGKLGLPTFKTPPAVAPAFTSPFSTDLMNRLYAAQQPVPGYISGDGTIGAAVLFLDMDNISLLANEKFVFTISTGAHGSSVPPPAPSYAYFMYYTGKAKVSGPGPMQLFMDTSGNYGGNDPTNPYQMSTYGQELFSGNSMYFPIGTTVGPGIPNNVYPTLFGSQAELDAWIAYITVGYPSPPFPSGQGPGPNYPWATPAPVTFPTNVGGFAWLAPPIPPAGSAECSWSITVKAWRRANNFAISAKGAIEGAWVDVNNKQIAVSPQSSQIVSSNGGNPRACKNVITVNPSSMQVSVQQILS